MSELFTVQVTTIYALSMPKFVFVKLVGSDTDNRVEADEVEDKASEIVLKLKGTIVAKFYKPNVQGWRFVDGQ